MELNDLQVIVNQFLPNDEVTTISRHGNGHIHDSFKVDTSQNRSVLLQRINSDVFKDVPALMYNLQLVTNHLNQKRVNSLKLVKGEGQTYLRIDNQYWRVFEFEPNSFSVDKPQSPEQAYSGGLAFGKFLQDLSNIKIESFKEVISRFHDLNFRLQEFRDALQSANDDRKKHARELTKFAQEHAQQLIDSMANTPIRITHNDTKFNNLLFRETKSPLVIDLDTVMPGITAYDFGDGIRTGAATTEEDEKDLDAVDFDLNMFEGFAKGYLKGCRDILEPEELASLSSAPAYMCFIIGVRFLTDYLSGDIYYPVQYPEHNFIRARNQLKLTGIWLKRREEVTNLLKS